jgi:hypothetical protein
MTQQMTAQRDFRVECHGSIWLFHPLTAQARAHLVEVSDAAPEIQFWGTAMVVETRYVDGVVSALSQNGFNVRAPGDYRNS